MRTISGFFQGEHLHSNQMIPSFFSLQMYLAHPTSPKNNMRVIDEQATSSFGNRVQIPSPAWVSETNYLTYMWVSSKMPCGLWDRRIVSHGCSIPVYGNCQMGTTRVFLKECIPPPFGKAPVVPSDVTTFLVDGGGLKIRGSFIFLYPILSSSPHKLIREKHFFLSPSQILPPSATKSFNKSFTKNVTFAMGVYCFGC